MYITTFFFNDTATTEIYTLSLHDALPIWAGHCGRNAHAARTCAGDAGGRTGIGTVQAAQGLLGQGRTGVQQCRRQDRKSTRLNSSHSQISYAVFCLKKKKNNTL